MPRPSHPQYSRFDSPAVSPADVDLGRVPEDTRLSVRCALAARLAAGASPPAARYAVARQFCLTVLTVEAIELANNRRE
jgi:hypothetical protein